LILRFKVDNFRSFRDAQELSLVASSRGEYEDSVVRPDGFGEGLLRIAAIYGANASGKSTLLRAMDFFVDAVRDSQNSWSPEAKIPTWPFALGEIKNEVSMFQLDFLVDGGRFQYGFSLDSSQIIREWLHSYPRGKRQVWFDRDNSSGTQIKFGKHLLGENRAIQNLTRNNSLFLSAAAQNNHEMLLPIFKWITSKITFLFQGRSHIDPEQAQRLENESLKERISKLLCHADLGIVGIELQHEAVDEKIAVVMDEVVKKVAELSPTSRPFRFTAPREFYRALLLHQGANGTKVTLNNNFESAGTVAFLCLLDPVLEAIENGGVLCVDELDASLHPLLALEIVRLFHDPDRNRSGAQLIFNTHDVNLLDADVLRRDEVWFTEKDQDGATHLYSLSDFKPRKSENLKRGYLQGRYGAVPYLGSMKFESSEV